MSEIFIIFALVHIEDVIYYNGFMIQMIFMLDCYISNMLELYSISSYEWVRKFYIFAFIGFR
jgi:hypothetical protein